MASRHRAGAARRIGPQRRDADDRYGAHPPLTGPVYVEGAEPGDPLAVKIEAFETAHRSCSYDGVARAGALVDEPPGEIHTLVVDEAVGAEVTELITLFNSHGAMVDVDDAGNTTGYDDVLTKLAISSGHYAERGLDVG